jgi:thioesterase domain-containing protein
LETGGETASLGDLAARHAEAILGVQPRGPYLLGGWSFGGVVAWETARRLEDLGHEVGLLVLIDSRPHDPHTPASPGLDDTALDTLLGTEARAGEEGLPGLRALVRAHLHALRGYRSEPVACPVTLFLAADRQRETAADRAALWRPLAPGGLEVETLPGDHFHLLTGPGADLLAAKLRARLAESDDQPA